MRQTIENTSKRRGITCRVMGLGLHPDDMNHAPMDFYPIGIVIVDIAAVLYCTGNPGVIKNSTHVCKCWKDG